MYIIVEKIFFSLFLIIQVIYSVYRSWQNYFAKCTVTILIIGSGREGLAICNRSKG